MLLMSDGFRDSWIIREANRICLMLLCLPVRVAVSAAMMKISALMIEGEAPVAML